MILIDDISAYYYMIRDGVPIYSDGKPAYLDSILDCEPSGSLADIPESKLFDFGPEPVHLLVTQKTHRSNPARVKYRVREKELPPKSFIKLTDNICIASPQLWFVELGLKVPLLRQMEMGSELKSRYSLSLDEDEEIIERHSPLVTDKELREYVASCTGMRGAVQARTAVKYLYAMAESPMETRTSMELSLPFKYGGLNLPKPLLNHRISLPEELWNLAERRSFRLDCYWPDHDVELEYMGKHSHPGTQRKSSEDSIRDTIINYLGIDSIEITEDQAKRRSAIELVARTLMKKMGLRYYRPPEWFEEKQRELFAEFYSHSTRCKRMGDLWS